MAWNVDCKQSKTSKEVYDNLPRATMKSMLRWLHIYVAIANIFLYLQSSLDHLKSKCVTCTKNR